MTCSAAGGGMHIHTPAHMHSKKKEKIAPSTSTAQNPCHCYLNGDICCNAQTGHSKKKICKNRRYHIYVWGILQNDLVRHNAAYKNHLNLTQQGPRCPKFYLFQVFVCFFWRKKRRKKQNHRSSKWIQSNFHYKLALQAPEHMCGLLPCAEEMALDACQSVFHSNQYRAYCCSPPACQCACVYVPKPCQLQGQNRGEERSDEIRGDDNSTLI